MNRSREEKSVLLYFSIVAPMLDGGFGLNIGPSPYGYITIAYLVP